MFVIVSDGRIVRARNNHIRIGRASDATVRLDGVGIETHHCEVVNDESGSWMIQNMAGTAISLNGNIVLSGRLVPFFPPSEVRLGPYTLEFRDSLGNTPISQGWRKKVFTLESELHKAVLDRLRTVAPGARKEREFIETELEQQFQGLSLRPELEKYLAAQALSRLMINEIQGYEEKSKSFIERRRIENARLPSILQKIKDLIQLDSDKSAAEKCERVEVLLPWALQMQSNLLQPEDKRELAIELLRDHLLDLIFGLGPLEDLMKAANINDVMVLPSGDIFIERDGKMTDSGRKMLSPEVSRRIVESIVTREGRRIDQTSPMVDARMTDGSRLNAIIQPIAVQGAALTIRRFADRRLSMDDLVENGTLTRGVAKFLEGCIKARKNIVISGGTGSGKTTLLNALAAHISPSERIITVEDTAEIQLSQVHVVTLQAKPPNLEGKSAISIRDLVRNTLRMRPDRIIVGECRGGEALDMLQAMNTGHDGSLTTIHANSPQDGLRRLEVMAMEAEDVKLPSRAIREQIASAVDVIVQISRLPSHSRRIKSVCEVVGIDEEDETIILEEVFTFRKQKGKGLFSRSALAFTGYIPTFFDDLLSAGAELSCLH